MSDMSDFERFARFEKFVAFGKANTGKYDSLLSDVDRALLDEFVKASRTGSMNLSEATSRSYRSYLAKAIAHPELTLTNNQRSAMRMFLAWLKTRG
jgi:hypothetical protein